MVHGDANDHNVLVDSGRYDWAAGMFPGLVDPSPGYRGMRFAETFGLSAAESMACALPVVGTRVGALTDLLPGADLARMGDAELP